MLQLSELFPKGKLNHFLWEGWRKHSGAGMSAEQKYFEYKFVFYKPPSCACVSRSEKLFVFVYCAVWSAQTKLEGLAGKA